MKLFSFITILCIFALTVEPAYSTISSEFANKMECCTKSCCKQSEKPVSNKIPLSKSCRNPFMSCSCCCAYFAYTNNIKIHPVFVTFSYLIKNECAASDYVVQHFHPPDKIIFNSDIKDQFEII